MVCHIPNNMIIESQLKPILFGNWTADSAYKLFSVSVLPPDLCDAWEISLNRLHSAFFMSHSDKDARSNAEFYADIVLPDSINTTNKDTSKSNTVGKRDKKGGNISEPDNCSDRVEYFPQPPGQAAVCGINASGGAPPADSKTITRPGRTYA